MIMAHWSPFCRVDRTGGYGRDVISGVECGNRCQLTEPAPSHLYVYSWLAKLGRVCVCRWSSIDKQSAHVETGCTPPRRDSGGKRSTTSAAHAALVDGWQSTYPIQVCTSGKDSLHISIGPISLTFYSLTLSPPVRKTTFWLCPDLSKFFFFLSLYFLI